MFMSAATMALSSATPSPHDLTPYIIKNGDQYSAGGSFGDVYKCRCIFGSGEMEVAVKAFRFKLTMSESDGRAAKMIRRELGIWKRLQHKNIVPFLGIAYGFGMGGTMSLVSSWMPNGTLREFLARRDSTLSLEHRLQLLLDIANGLHYCTLSLLVYATYWSRNLVHSFPTCPVVHGDMNCNNILLDANNTACLTDFGYASLVGDIPEALTYLEMSTIRPGALRWAAPEQVLPGETSCRTAKSDIYSFGCISLEESLLYSITGLFFIILQVLSGKQPWAEVEKDTHILLLLAKGQKPRRPQSRAILDRHWELIEQCWLSLQERPSAQRVVTSIEAFLSDSGLVTFCDALSGPLGLLPVDEPHSIKEGLVSDYYASENLYLWQDMDGIYCWADASTVRSDRPVTFHDPPLGPLGLSVDEPHSKNGGPVSDFYTSESLYLWQDKDGIYHWGDASAARSDSSLGHPSPSYHAPALASEVTHTSNYCGYQRSDLEKPLQPATIQDNSYISHLAQQFRNAQAQDHRSSIARATDHFLAQGSSIFSDSYPSSRRRGTLEYRSSIPVQSNHQRDARPPSRKRPREVLEYDWSSENERLNHRGQTRLCR